MVTRIEQSALSGDTLMTKEEVAAFFRVTLRTIHKWMRYEKLPHIHLSARATRFRRADIEAWANARAQYLPQAA